MQFTVIARDSTSEGTLERRLANRDQHLKRIHELKADGVIIDGGAILDADGKMIGSVVLYDVPDRAALDAVIADEIYYQQGVWKDLDVLPFRRVVWHLG